MSLALIKRHPMSLSQQELCAISERISRDYAPRFSRHGHAAGQGMPFSSQELQAISHQISLDFAPSRRGDQSQLVLMAVSPQRLHVYWQVPNQKLPQQPISSNDQTSSRQPEALTLRIYGVSPPSPGSVSLANSRPVEMIPGSAAPFGAAEKVSSFQHSAPPCVELTLESWQGQQDIVLPQAQDAVPIRYNAVLGRSGATVHFKPLAYSNMAAVPISPRSRQDHSLDPVIEQLMTLRDAPSSFSAGGLSGQGEKTL